MSATLERPLSSTTDLNETRTFDSEFQTSNSDVEAMSVAVCQERTPAGDLTTRNATRRAVVGPGVFGSVAWWVWLFAANFVAALFVGATSGFIYAFQAAANGTPLTGDQISQMITQAPTFGLWLGLISTALIIWSVRWRMKSGTPKMTLPNRTELALLVSMVIPLFIVSLSVYDITDAAWKFVYTSLPPAYQTSLGFMKGDAIVKELSGEFGTVNFVLLLMTVAVFPAIAEESIFRGAIGRGLISRYGVVAGIISTSFLFGLAHIYPAHVASAFVLGLVAHSVYRITQNFSAPLLVHLLNNTLVIGLGSLAARLVPETADTNFTVWPYGIPAAAWVVTAVYLMHRNRVLEQKLATV